MKTVTSASHQEKIKIMDKEIVLNGPPSDLHGNIHFVNHEKEPLRIKTIGLLNEKRKKTENGGRDFMNFSFRLQPGEQKMEAVNHQLPFTTPPGTYESYVELGGQRHKVKMVLQPTIDIEIFPDEFTFQGTSPGTTHVATITLANKGNMPFQVPELKHAAVLDMDLLCRAFGTGFREKGKDDLMSTLDEVTRNLKDNLTDWVSISVDEKGQILQPGESMLIHVNFELPKNAGPKRDYEGNFRFWDQDISVNIKSHRDNSKNNSYEQQAR